MRSGPVRNAGNYTNPCLTMHQPWASLLVCGIKRIEGRSWPAPIRGRLWIHAASKVPDEATIKAMEEFYREIYAVNGITDIKFPEHYPVSRLLGCVEVVGCVKCEELQNWEALPEGVRLEGQTNFCWLCEQPQKLIVPFEMRGYQGIYNLEKKIYEASVRGLAPVKSPLPVKFPLPDPKDPFSLKPGSISSTILMKKPLEVEQSNNLTAAIAGARAAATQFSRKGQNLQTNTVQSNARDYVTRSKSKSVEEDARPVDAIGKGSPETSATKEFSGKEQNFQKKTDQADAYAHVTSTRSKSMSIAKNNRSADDMGEGCNGSTNNTSDDVSSKACRPLTINYGVKSNKRTAVTKGMEQGTSSELHRNRPIISQHIPGAARIMAAAMRSLKPSS